MILDKAAAVIRKDALTALRYRNGFFLNAFAPAAQLVMFYYLAQSIGQQFRPEGLPYFVFLVIGTGFYTFLISGAHCFLRIIQEAQQAGTLEVLMTSATPAPVLIFLSMISAFAGEVLQLLVYVAVGFVVFRIPLHPNLAGSLLVFVLSVAIILSFGLMAAALQISTHKGSAALWILGSTAWVFSGTLFSASALPSRLRLISELLPMTHSLNAMRLAVMSQNPSGLSKEIGLLVLFCALLVPFSLWFFSWTVKRARQLGTLSFC
jgi:ABC-2 type transport system permease protein